MRMDEFDHHEMDGAHDDQLEHKHEPPESACGDTANILPKGTSKRQLEHIDKHTKSS